jgi:hypothetical protein
MDKDIAVSHANYVGTGKIISVIIPRLLFPISTHLPTVHFFMGTTSSLQSVRRDRPQRVPGTDGWVSWRKGGGGVLSLCTRKPCKRITSYD